MIEIEEQPWRDMIAQAEAIYPDECCGAMLGQIDGQKTVRRIIPLANVATGPKRSRYQLAPEDLICAERQARSLGMDLIGIYHSHPDCAAYFSETDLKNSCPWYSFVVIAVREGRFDHANSWLPDAEQIKAEKEDLICPKF